MLWIFQSATYESLASVFSATGDTAAADSLWREALATGSLEHRANAARSMLDYEERAGDAAGVALAARRLISLSDSLGEQRRTERVGELQTAFDMETARQRERSIRIYATLSLLIFMLMAATATIYARYRYEKMKSREKDDKLNRAILKDTIAELEQEHNSDSKTIDELKKVIDVLERKRSDAVNRGQSLYHDIMFGGGTTEKWKRRDFCDVVDFYSTVDAVLVYNLRTAYNDLSPKYQLYLILLNENKQKEEIKAIMRITESRCIVNQQVQHYEFFL